MSDAPKREIRFLTKNDSKFGEFRKLFEGSRYSILKSAASIEEVQTDNMEALVTDKVIKAFQKVRRPIFVDHTGLQLHLLQGFPGGLTEIFWNKIGNKRLSDIVGRSEDSSVMAVTLIGYCDGRSVKIFRGEIRGKISPSPEGPEGFQWDPIFIPDGFSKTFAEMGEQKNQISMRRKAIDAFIAHLDREA